MIQVRTQDPAASVPAVSKPVSEWDRMAVAIDVVRPQSLACYQAALRRNPYAYGEVVVAVSVDGEGRARDASVVLETLGDDALVTCIEGIVRNVKFPVPGTPGTNGRYPFLFTSDLTPPEVVRALQDRYGLLPPEPMETDHKGMFQQPPLGTVVTW